MVNVALTMRTFLFSSEVLFRGMTTPQINQKWVTAATTALRTETSGLESLTSAMAGPLGAAFCDAVNRISKTTGRVVVTGIGKSGHVARKIAATLASTGTPALFVHPAEASHGDLGMITPDDVVLMLSKSGESLELKDLLLYTRRFAVTLIVVTAFPKSTLGIEADVVLTVPDAPEACPIGLAPTTGTLLQLALGDALAVVLLENRGFTARDFRNFHPGGKLGASLKHVEQIMRQAESLPLIAQDCVMAEALVTMTAKSLGCLGVCDAEGKLVGVITDGDLRRHMSPEILSQSAHAIMTKNPKTISRLALASEALEALNSAVITSIFVVDDGGAPIGLVHIHDLLRQGVA